MEELIFELQNALGETLTEMSVATIIGLSAMAVLLSLLLVYLLRIHIAYRMAKNRHRDPIGWVLFSFFVSPVMTWIILLLIGDAKDE